MTLSDDLQEHPVRAGLDLGRQQAQGLKGFAVTLRHLFRRPVTQPYPEHKRAVYPRFRGRHRLHRHPNGLEKCIGCSLCAAACPADCIRVVAAENEPDAPRLAGRALRAHLRDQHGALHLLRLLRDRVPVRCDHARQRLRALGAVARRARLHQGDAARAAAAPHARAGPGAVRPRRAGDRGRRRARHVPRLLAESRRGARRADADRGLLRGGRARDRLGDRRGRAAQPVPGRALADPAPGLAGRALPRAAGRLRRRRAAARLRRRRHDHVPLRDRLPGRSGGSRPETRRPRSRSRGHRRPRDLHRERDRRERLQQQFSCPGDRRRLVRLAGHDRRGCS